MRCGYRRQSFVLIVRSHACSIVSARNAVTTKAAKSFKWNKLPDNLRERCLRAQLRLAAGYALLSKPHLSDAKVFECRKYIQAFLVRVIPLPKAF